MQCSWCTGDVCDFYMYLEKLSLQLFNQYIFPQVLPYLDLGIFNPPASFGLSCDSFQLVKPKTCFLEDTCSQPASCFQTVMKQHKNSEKSIFLGHVKASQPHLFKLALGSITHL